MENKKINFNDTSKSDIRKLPFELQFFIAKFGYKEWMWEVYLQNKNPEIELKIFQKGYELKYVDFSNYLAHRYLNGIGVKQDFKKAQEIMKCVLFKFNAKYSANYKKGLISRFKL